MNVRLELEFLAEQILLWTKAYVSNGLKDSKVLKTGYSYIYRRYEYLASINIMASCDAIKQFEKIFGKNTNKLTTYYWGDRLNSIVEVNNNQYVNNDKKFKKVNINSKATNLYWEHFDTASDFKKWLTKNEKGNTLTRDLIIERLEKSSVCWITRDEQLLLDKKYKNNRKDPFKIFQKLGITICDYGVKENIMKMREKNELTIFS